MGRGARSRSFAFDDAGATIDAEQARIADAGIKGMIPLGRPFLEYVIAFLRRNEIARGNELSGHIVADRRR